MKFKLLVKFFLVLNLAAGLWVLSAENLVPNPGMEEGSGNPEGWLLRENGAASTEAHGGKRSILLKGKHGDKWNVLSSTVFGLKPGAVYTLSFWAKVDGGGTLQGGLREIDQDGKTITYTWQKTRNNAGWVFFTLLVTTRPTASTGQIYFQAMEDFSGQALMDDVSLVEGGDPEGAKIRTAARKPSVNLLEDPGLEAGAKGWSLPAEGHLSKNGGATDPSCLVIQNPDRKKKAPFATFSVNDIPGNREYLFTARVKSMGTGQEGPKIKIEFYNQSGEMTGGAYSLPIIAAGVWNQVKVKLRASRDAVRASILLRMFGDGEALFDDLDFHFTDPVPFDVEVFPSVAYTGKTLNPLVNVFLNQDDLSAMNGFQIRLGVVDADTGAVFQAPTTLKADKAVLPFSLNLPTSKPWRYRIEVALLDAGGKVRHATNDLAIVVDAPSLVRKGYYEVAGKPFFPIGAYHVYKNETEYPILAAAGFNAVQGSGDHNLKSLKKYLDRANSNGLYYCLPLYGGMKVRENFSNTRAKLQAFAAHPALLGLWSMDEPDVWGATPQELVELRSIIAAGTDRHPASSVIFPPSAHFMSQQESMDVIYVDPYPKKKNPEPITAVRSWIDGAKRAGKPIVCVVQAFEILPAWPKPTPAELENYIYQSLIHGVVGIFYYSLSDPGWSLMKSDLWEKTLQMNREMNALAAVLLSEPMRRETWNIKSSPSVDAVAAVVNGETWVLAVNVTDKEAELALSLPAGAKGAVTAVFGRGKPIVKDGMITDRIEPLGSRVFVVK